MEIQDDLCLYCNLEISYNCIYCYECIEYLSKYDLDTYTCTLCQKTLIEFIECDACNNLFCLSCSEKNYCNNCINDFIINDIKNINLK
jgi:hypothetical protein